mgnify:CR=1 FL=1
MKNERQEKILAIIAASAIETQEQLIDSLRKEGISCTQATISRDIKQLHLIKEPTGNGTYRYAVSTQKMRLNLADRLHAHKSGKGAKCTRALGAQRFAYLERCTDKSAALRREAALKKLPKAQKELLCTAWQAAGRPFAEHGAGSAG